MAVLDLISHFSYMMQLIFPKTLWNLLSDFLLGIEVM